MMVRFGAALVAALLTSGAQAAAHKARAAKSPVSASAAQQPEPLSESVATLLRWVAASGDNNHLPFIVVDKLGARVSVFDAKGKLLGSAPALLGMGRGDDSVPGMGTVRMGMIPVEQRTTPAGRFIARFGPAKGHPPVLWVDYADAIALHPVVTKNKQERRLERIKSTDTDDHRISYGCINVPASFFARTVKPQFKSKSSSSVVYILPDTKKLTEVFPAIMLQASATSSGSTREAAAGGV
jgi:hypothetical protein